MTQSARNDPLSPNQTQNDHNGVYFTEIRYPDPGRILRKQRSSVGHVHGMSSVGILLRRIVFLSAPPLS